MATTWLELTVGVFLVLLSIAMVILFIFLCWGITWKLLLSRLGLFKELFSNNNNTTSGSHANKTTSTSSKGERSRGTAKPRSSSRVYHGQQQHQRSSARTGSSETKKRVTIATSEPQSEHTPSHTDHDTGISSETSKDV